MAVTLSATLGSAQSGCPSEVAEAKALLAQQTAKAQDVQAPRSLAGARAQDIQAPRAQDVQAPRTQDVQAPRSQGTPQAPRAQDVQAPRAQDVQAPRSQDIQAPRSQDVQAPRSQDIQAPRTKTGASASSAQAARSADYKKAAALVKEAEAACKSGNTTMASEKAKAAIALLKK
ncbi:MAG TPA: hypothetical protein VFN71_02445 [Methylomirabilota bacterium]|nr:hypothetical protein [Methylomirabilota bacterium]